MTSFTHAAVGLGVASFFKETPEAQPAYHYAVYAVGFSLLPDLDHLLFLRTMKLKVGGMRHARTFMHELLGTAVWTALGLGVMAFHFEIGCLFIACLSAHLFCDFINGYSEPFKRIRAAPGIDMGKSLRTRIVQEILVGGLSLWLFFAAFLAG